MDLNEDSQLIIQELQVLEHNLNNILMQKQQFQLELGETSNALEEVTKTSEEIYKMVGSIMVKADKKKVTEELTEKKKILELRNESLNKQENLLESKAKELQDKLKTAMEDSQKN